MAEHPGARSSTSTFLVWLGSSRTNTKISVTHPRHMPPQITMSDQARWRGVVLLLHNTTAWLSS